MNLIFLKFSILINMCCYILQTAALHEFYGMTQDPETKNYMMVLNDICEKCKCVCYAIHFQQNFKNWTSGNNGIDKFIQDTQLSAHNFIHKVLEWIPYNRLRDINYVTEEEIGKVYRANWIDGCIIEWNRNNKNWTRKDQNMFVILKSLGNSKIVNSDFISKVQYRKFIFYLNFEILIL